MKKIMTFAAIALLSNHAQAELSGDFLYYGAALQLQSFADLPAPDHTAASSTGLGYRVFAGYQLNSWLGVELGGQKLANAEYRPVNPINSGRVVESTGLALDTKLIASYSLNEQWFARAQAGVLLWRNEKTDRTVTPSSTVTVKDSGNSLVYGVGLGYSFDRELAVSLDVEKSAVAEQDYRALRLSMMWKF
jgi:hypothetical protein